MQRNSSPSQNKVPDAIQASRILDRVPGMVAVYNIQSGHYTYVNNSVQKILGYSPQDFLVGGFQFASSLVHPEDIQPLTRQNQKALVEANRKANKVHDNLPIVTFEYRIRHKNGTYRWLHTDGVVYDRDEKGTVTHVMNISIDITRRRERELYDAQARKQFEEKQQYLAAIVASSDDAIISKTLDGIITSWNKAAYRIFGFTAKEAIGQHITLIIPKEHRQEEERIVNTLKQGKHIDHFETVRITKNGKRILVSLSISPIKDDQGTIIGASKIARDITQQKLIEQTAQQSQERLQLAVDAGKIGIWDWDIQKNEIIWSDRVYEIHGVRKGKNIGELEKYRRFHHPEDAERINHAIQQAIAGIKPYQEEFRIITPSGKTRWIETKAVVIKDKSGKPRRMLGATMDITNRKNLEQQKDEFVGIASHELKTPVTSIKAYTQLLESKFSKEGNEKAALMLTKVNAQLNKLTALIGDLLDITKIETGKLEFYEEYFDFNEMVQEIVEEIQLTTTTHKLVMNLDQTKSVYGDRDRIGQVLTNFLTNAVKYSPYAQKIHISTKLSEEAICVSVRDFGIGIPKDSKDKVFERFFRVTTSSGQTFPGIGLGLYISSQIIKRQQGKVWVHSQKGKGSTFSFSIPIRRKAKKK